MQETNFSVLQKKETEMWDTQEDFKATFALKLCKN